MYMVVCATHGIIDIINMAIIQGKLFEISETYYKSYQPCKMFTGSFIGDAITYFIYWWVIWCFWGYSFLYIVWPTVKKPE